MHKLELTNEQFHYVSALLANRAYQLETIITDDTCKPIQDNESKIIESLLSDKFISL